MKKMIPLVVAASALLTAAPAFAQNYGGGYGDGRPGYDRPGYDRPGHDYGYGPGDHRGFVRVIDQRQYELSRRIDRSFEMRRISRHEYVGLRAELGQIERLEHRYMRSGRGLDRQEFADLDRRLDRLQARFRWDRRDDNWSGGYGPGRDGPGRDGPGRDGPGRW